MKRILAISGGGMRGVIPARFLIEIENRTGGKIAEIFSLILQYVERVQSSPHFAVGRSRPQPNS